MSRGYLKDSNIILKAIFSLLLYLLCLKEHKCVLDSCRALESEGFDVTYLPVMKNGLIDVQVLYASFNALDV